MVVSEDYLKSANCMFELLEIAKNGRFRDRVQPVVARGSPVFKPKDKIRYLKYWETEAKEIEQGYRTLDHLDHAPNIQKALDLYREIRLEFDAVWGIVTDMNALTQDAHLETDFSALIGRIRATLGTQVPPSRAKSLPVGDESLRGKVSDEIDRLLV